MTQSNEDPKIDLGGIEYDYTYCLHDNCVEESIYCEEHSPKMLELHRLFTQLQYALLAEAATHREESNHVAAYIKERVAGQILQHLNI